VSWEGIERNRERGGRKKGDRTRGDRGRRAIKDTPKGGEGGSGKKKKI